MKLLVTGGAGFIGSNFIHYWLSKYKDDEILNLDKLTYAGRLENLKDIASDLRYAFVKGDIADPKIVQKAIKGVDVVVHFAAESFVDRSILGPQVFILTNVLGTQILLDAALKEKVKRFHHVSTDEVFGSLSLTSGEKFNEESPFNPSSPYAASKAASDHLILSYFKTYGLPITITNTSNNFGPYQHPEKFLPLLITNALEDKPIPVYGDGKYIRDWVYVLDHCRAIDLVLKKGKEGETYCVGGENEVVNLDLVKKILKILGKNEKLIKFVKDRPGHDRKYALDSGKIKKELGFSHQFRFEQALLETIDWYKNNQWWWEFLKKAIPETYYEN